MPPTGQYSTRVYNFDRLAQDLVLQRLLAEDSFEFPDPLLQCQDLCLGDDLIVHPDRLFPTFAHAASPTEDQAGRNTMTTGYIGNRHAGLGSPAELDSA